MKSKLLLMSLALISTLSSKCAYGMDNPNINRHIFALRQLANNNAFAKLIIGKDMLKDFCRTHAAQLDANFVKIILNVDLQNQIIAVDPAIVNFFETNHVSNQLLQVLPAPQTFQSQTSDNIFYRAMQIVTTNSAINNYLSAREHRWELLENDGPTKFSIELMNFFTEYPTLNAQDNAYAALLQTHLLYGGHADSSEYYGHYFDGNIADALNLLINNTDSSPAINECRRKLIHFNDPEPIPSSYIESLPKINMICHNIALNRYLKTKNINANLGNLLLKERYAVLNRYELDIPQYLIRLGVIDVQGDGDCGYRAMDTDINRATSAYNNTSRKYLIEHLLAKINGENGDLLKKMVADEIAFIAACVPDKDEIQFFNENNLYEILKLFAGNRLINELVDQASALAMNCVPQYLTFLKNNNIWMRLIPINGLLSGVSAAIAHSLGKNLIVVDANGQIAYKYYAMLPDTMFIAYVCKMPLEGESNTPDHFQKCFIIK